MEVININNKIYDLVKKKQYDELHTFIKNNEDINLDIPDENFNNLIDYLILDEKINIIKYLLENERIRLDVLDNENKSILFKPIKYNKLEILKLIVEYDKKNIGISILEKKDLLGQNCLFYCITFNNLIAFKYLYDNNADIYCIDQNKNNLFFYLLKYERNSMMIYLLDKELKKNNLFLSLTNSKMNESILQNSIIYDNNKIINYILNLNLSEDYINNQESEYGLNSLHNSLILRKNNISKILIDKNININIQDYLGNTALHYSIIEKNLEMAMLIAENSNTNFNLINLEGNLPLHFLLEDENMNNLIFEDNSKQSEIYQKLLLKMIIKSKLNIQNNYGITPLYFIVKNNLWKIDKVKTILEKKSLNIFIKNNDNEIIFDIVGQNEEFINLVINSFYYKLLNTKKQTNIDWEEYCSTGNLKELAKLLKKKGDKSIDFYCKEKIKDIILNEKRSLPKYKSYELVIEKGIYKKGCYYTGSTIDILFGLLFLFKKYSNIKLILEYPLTENNKLIDYYKKLGINFNYKLDFSNIEIVWIYQKIIYPVNFDAIFKNKFDNLDEENNFIIIPLGIEVENGSHANILIVDVENKLIERFEPNGFYGPREFFYNPDLLDNLLQNKFTELLPNFKYLAPNKYLPIISFQILESLETEKCKKIGDPNGFCAVWCIWWAYYRIQYKNIKSSKLAKLLINKIKFNKLSFKEIIRNFSQRITEIRDEYLEKYNIDINMWMNDNYDEEILNNIEKDVLEFIR